MYGPAKSCHSLHRQLTAGCCSILSMAFVFLCKRRPLGPRCSEVSLKHALLRLCRSIPPIIQDYFVFVGAGPASTVLIQLMRKSEAVSLTPSDFYWFFCAKHTVPLYRNTSWPVARFRTFIGGSMGFTRVIATRIGTAGITRDRKPGREDPLRGRKLYWASPTAVVVPAAAKATG